MKEFPKLGSVEYYEYLARYENSMGHINTAEEYWSKADTLRIDQEETDGSDD